MLRAIAARQVDEGQPLAAASSRKADQLYKMQFLVSGLIGLHQGVWMAIFCPMHSVCSGKSVVLFVRPWLFLGASSLLGMYSTYQSCCQIPVTYSDNLQSRSVRSPWEGTRLLSGANYCGLHKIMSVICWPQIRAAAHDTLRWIPSDSCSEGRRASRQGQAAVRTSERQVGFACITPSRSPLTTPLQIVEDHPFAP